MALKLIVGLGNPGLEYVDTRHNIGFVWLEALAAQEKTPLAMERKFHGRVGRLAGNIWLLCPTTYMNKSGLAVQTLSQFHKIAPEEILVVHDELDLLPGDARLKQGGSPAGHNGLKDIQAQLGSANFWRLRIGVGHPRALNQPGTSVLNWVLHRPSRGESTAINQALDRALAIWPLLASGLFDEAMQRLHTKPKPPSPSILPSP